MKEITDEDVEILQTFVKSVESGNLEKAVECLDKMGISVYESNGEYKSYRDIVSEIQQRIE